ncbi:recombination regulator RecX [Streptomyces sp. NPDC094143]|uniref:recombination regulator RecX n=1 Tax=Streptomyces sp. NPDC094143 TaxID=3155310 RepID=UPI003327BB8F
MTRRTDWAEYEYAASGAPRGRGTGGGTGSSVDGEGTHEDIALYGGDRLHRGDRLRGGSGPHGDDGLYGHDDLDGDEGPGRGEGLGGDREAYGRGDPREGDGPHGGSGPHGDERPYGGGTPRGDSRGGGTRRGRGRRRRGFGEAADAEDGGALSSSRAEQEAPPGDPVEQARAICLRLLTGTPRTRKQLADALRKRQIPDEAAEEVLSRFEEVGLINDGAFADAWVESRHHGRGLARRALAQELRTKGVDSTLIDAAVSQLDSEQEETTARELVDRKLRSTRGLDRDKRLRRLAGMLARKGYPEGMALRVVRQALEEEGEDTDFPVGEEF